MPPCIAAPRSVRMSPKRLEATTTSSCPGAAPCAPRARPRARARSGCPGWRAATVGGDLVPEHVAVARGVGLGRARDERRAARRRGSKACSTTRSMPARVNTAVSMPTSLGVALVHAAADAGVLALGVLAHEDHVDVARRTAGERARHALEQPHGAHVGPQVEALADRQQQPPERHVVGNVGPPDGAEQDRHRTRAGARRRPAASSRRARASDRSPSRARSTRSRAQLVDAATRLADDFWAYAVAGQERDAMRHWRDPSERGQVPRTRQASMPPACAVRRGRAQDGLPRLRAAWRAGARRRPCDRARAAELALRERRQRRAVDRAHDRVRPERRPGSVALT